MNELISLNYWVNGKLFIMRHCLLDVIWYIVNGLQSAIHRLPTARSVKNMGNMGEF